jgi:hypothetical protein
MKATNRMFRVYRVAIAVLALSACAATSSADIMTFDGVGLTDWVTINAPGVHESTPAGQILVTYNGQAQIAFCVDIYQWASNMQVEQWSINQLHNGDKVAWLYEQHAGSITTGTEAAALQVAIWEVINETGNFDVKTGTFSVNGSVQVWNLANNWLAAMPSTYTPTFDFKVLHSGTYQDMLIGGPMAPVPEPATMALLAVGGCLVVLRRRRETA